MDRADIITAFDGFIHNFVPCCTSDEYNLELFKKVLELLKNDPVKPRLMRDWYVCECGASITMQVDGEPFRKSQYCCACGKPVDWT